MRIAVSLMSGDLDGEVSSIFARCPYFVVAEIKDQKIEKSEVIKNGAQNQMGGAGPFAAQLMAEKGVNAIITGNIGPRALDVLKQFDIEIYLTSGSVKKALEDFIGGKLKKRE